MSHEASAENPGEKNRKLELGVAFSGGGIRSAAFCSGVLRRLIGTENEPDVLSCVSGGGYTGSAYVQWKYRQGNGSSPKDWAEKFFINMRNNVGIYCNWSGCCTGFWDSIILVFLIIFAILFSLITALAFAFPIAFVVNIFYGRFLNSVRCSTDADSADCTERKYLFLASLGFFLFFM